MTIHSNFFSYITCSLQKYITTHLRRSAADDKIFKLFFLHPFLASTIYNNTIKNKFDIGSVVFFFRYRLLNRQPIFNFENLQNFA